jgi:hypothetical protein
MFLAEQYRSVIPWVPQEHESSARYVQYFTKKKEASVWQVSATEEEVLQRL